MIDFNFTNEELEALKNYKEKNYEAINQMLVNDAETDIALLSSEVENDVVSISYDRMAVIEYLKSIKLIYSLILKYYCSLKVNKLKTIYRGTNLSEIERIKSELFIDRMLSTSENKDEAINVYSSVWNRPACINITLDEDVPYIIVKDVLRDKKYKNEIIISPFTKIKFISEDEEQKIDRSAKVSKSYNIDLEKQILDELSERERAGLYQYILDNAYYIKKKIVECIELEKENAINFENIRKLEQLLSKYETELEEKEDSDDMAKDDVDYDDIERITHELKELKKLSTSLFEVRKENINFINMWKRNIAVYMIAECREIEKRFEGIVSEENSGINFVSESYIPETEENENIEPEANVVEEIKTEEVEKEETFTEEIVEDTVSETVIEQNSDTEEVEVQNEVENISNEIIEEIQNLEQPKFDITETKILKIVKDAIFGKKEEVKEETEKEIEETVVIENVEFKPDTPMDALEKRVKEECEENLNSVETLLTNIKDLITKQQNHAKIAGNTGAVYSALNNAFEMRKVSETLQELLKNISAKVEVICEIEKDENIKREKLEDISNKSVQISTLFNYLNNPKIATQNSKATRFDEMAIIEENELKRGIAERIRSIRSEAELKKLKDDLDIIETKGSLSRFFGFFTGQNKLDDFMIEQIEIRQLAIRRTISKNLSLAYNYSIHELMAEIDMFIKENEDDELVFDDVTDLKAMADELRRNFIILDSKVQSIVEKKEGKHLLLDNKKITRKEIIEIETYRFLNKYGYDISKKENEAEPRYQDTMSNEIARIVEYINSAKIL